MVAASCCPKGAFREPTCPTPSSETPKVTRSTSSRTFPRGVRALVLTIDGLPRQQALVAASADGKPGDTGKPWIARRVGPEASVNRLVHAAPSQASGTDLRPAMATAADRSRTSGARRPVVGPWHRPQERAMQATMRSRISSTCRESVPTAFTDGWSRACRCARCPCRPRAQQCAGCHQRAGTPPRRDPSRKPQQLRTRNASCCGGKRVC